MPRRAYESQPISDADRAFVRSLVIYEDAAILAFDKPSGLPVQTRNPDDRTLDSLLAAFAKSNGKRPRLVHRLDAQTSGLIVAAKTQPAAAFLSAAFATRDVAKTYLAIVSGPSLDAPEGEIDAPLARHRPKPQLELMRAARPGDDAQSALTRWRLIASAGTTHLLDLRPETGRMHQLRAHLSIIGRPILGDPYYGGQSILKGEPVPRLMLHAHSLDLPHPHPEPRQGRESKDAGERLRLKTPPPAGLRAVLSAAGLSLPADLA